MTAPSSRCAPLWHRAALSALVGVACGVGAALGAPPVCLDFDGVLPASATLTRASDRVDGDGVVVPVDTARWVDGLVAPAARLLTMLPESSQIAGIGDVGGVTYTAIVDNLLNVQLTTDLPLCDVARSTLTTHPSVGSRFGFSGAEWGAPKSVEIHPDGTMLVHTTAAGPQLRSLTLRTTIGTFASQSGWSLVRTSDYAPPAGEDPTQIPHFFTRTTFLPNLGVVVSTIAEYEPDGLISSVDASDGRSLGYASTDAGLTWTRVIDTDDPSLGQSLVLSAKHMHHLEPFEWFDPVDQAWKIGAVGCLGDVEGQSGQIWVYSPFATFPVEGQNHLLHLERTRAPGRRALTDLFPLDPSAEPGQPMRFLHGQDGELGGIIEASVVDGVEGHRYLCRPTVPHVRTSLPGFVELPQYPFIFQMDRLGNGSIVATTTEGSIAGDPNGFWISDPAGERWTTIRLADTVGFKGVAPVGNDRFWTLSLIGHVPSLEFRHSLWEVGAPLARRPILLGAGTESAAGFALFDDVASSGSFTDVTGQFTGPAELPAPTWIYRMTSTTLAPDSHFAEHTQALASADPGEFVHFETWMRPVPEDASVATMLLEMELITPGGQPIPGSRLMVDMETKVWTRIALIEPVPAQGAASARVKARLLGSVSASKPLDFLCTESVLFVASQPVAQWVPSTGVADDRLSVALPALGSEWTVAVWATEAMTFAMSLVDGAGDAISVLPRALGSFSLATGADTGLELGTLSGGVPTDHGASSAQDVFVPTQDLVVIRKTQPGDAVEMWVSRGMGDPELVSAGAFPITPQEIRFGAPDWSVVFEGEVHRVKVWADVALSETAIRRERLAFDGACGDAPAVDVSEPQFPCAPIPPEPCVGDIDGNNATDVLDFGILAASFGQQVAPGTGADLNGDGSVNVLDFGILAGNFGCVFDPPPVGLKMGSSRAGPLRSGAPAR